MHADPTNMSLESGMRSAQSEHRNDLRDYKQRGLKHRTRESYHNLLQYVIIIDIMHVCIVQDTRKKRVMLED